MSCTVSQEWSIILAELLLAEKKETRVWLRTEMDRLMDPMLDSIFDRLFKQLETNGMKRRQSGGDGDDYGQLIMNHNGQMHQSSFVIAQPSTSSHLIPQHQNVIHYSYQQPTNDPIHCNENINQQFESISFVQPTMYPYSQVNFEQVSNEPTDYCPSLSPTTVSNLQFNYNSNDLVCEDENEDEGECYCDECLGVVEIDEEVEDDDDSDSVQCIEDEQEIPEKRARLDSTQPNKPPPEVARLSQGQLTEDAQPNKVIDHDKQIITVHLRCPELECPDTFTETELNSHMMERHLIGPNRCLVKDCKQSFDNCRILGDHIKHIHKHTTQWHCGKCSKHFTSYLRLSIHNNDYHQLGHFQCSFPLCSFTGEYRKKVYPHYESQHKPDIVCQQSGCSFRCKHLSKFKAHERGHFGIKPYRCKWFNCHYSHASRNYTMIHIKQSHFNSKTSSSDVALSGKPADYLEVVHSLL